MCPYLHNSVSLHCTSQSTDFVTRFSCPSGFLFLTIRRFSPGVTGQNIPPARIYPGLKRPRLDYTRVYYGLGQFISRGILWPRPIHTPSGQIIHVQLYTHYINLDINSVERYTQELFNFSTSY